MTWVSSECQVQYQGKMFEWARVHTSKTCQLTFIVISEANAEHDGQLLGGRTLPLTERQWWSLAAWLGMGPLASTSGEDAGAGKIQKDGGQVPMPPYFRSACPPHRLIKPRPHANPPWMEVSTSKKDFSSTTTFLTALSFTKPFQEQCQGWRGAEDDTPK